MINIIVILLSSIQKEQLNISRSQVRATWQQVHFAHEQLIVTFISVIIAAIWLFIHLYSRKIHWHPLVKNIKKGNVNGISISLMNSSNVNANDTIILKNPLYILCSFQTATDIIFFNSLYSYNRFKGIIHWLFRMFGKSNLKDYISVFSHCYVKNIYIPFLNRIISRMPRSKWYKMKSFLIAEQRLSQCVSGVNFQIYGNRTNPTSIFISLKTLSLIFKRQRRLYNQHINYYVHIDKYRYMMQTKYFKYIKNKRPFYPLWMSFLDIKYLNRYRHLLYLRKLSQIKLHNLRKLRKYNNKSKDRFNKNSLPSFYQLVPFIIIPCYDLKLHKIQIVRIDGRKL